MQWRVCQIIGTFLIILGYTTFDQPITLFFYKTPKEVPYFASIFSWLVSPEVHLVAWPILFFTFFYLLRKQKMHTLLTFTIAVPCSILAVDILKVIFGRTRPLEWLNEGIYGFTWFGTNQNFWSFPSGHAAAIGAVMGVVSCLKPKGKILCFVFAIILASSRILEMKHFFSDIVSGVLLAFLISQSIYKIVQEQRNNALSR